MKQINHAIATEALIYQILSFYLSFQLLRIPSRFLPSCFQYLPEIKDFIICENFDRLISDYPSL